MQNYERASRTWMGTLAVPAALSLASIVGCSGSGGNGDTNAILRPSVIAVAPVKNATEVPITNPTITATFSEQMAPITGSATFTVSSELLGNVSGSVELDSTKRIATFTLAPNTILVPFTLYTATVNGATSNTTGRAIQDAYVWTFTTGIGLATNDAIVGR